MLNLCLSFILNRVNNVERRENNGGSLNFRFTVIKDP